MVVSETTCNIAVGYMSGSIIALGSMFRFMVFFIVIYLIYKVFEMWKVKERLKMEYSLALRQNAKQIQNTTTRSNRIRK